MAKFRKYRSLAKYEVKNAAHVGGGVAVGAGLLYVIYEGWEYFKYKRFLAKNPTATLTFAQFKGLQPSHETPAQVAAK